MKICRKRKSQGILTLIYSLLIFSGGIVGFALKDSLPSLIAGGVCGLALLFASTLLLGERRGGVATALVFIAALLLFFAYRFFTSFRFMPAGLMLLISSITLILFLLFSKLKTSPQKSSS